MNRGSFPLAAFILRTIELFFIFISRIIDIFLQVLRELPLRWFKFEIAMSLGKHFYVSIFKAFILKLSYELNINLSFMLSFSFKVMYLEVFIQEI